MKTKLISSNFNDGVSSVVINTPYGFFKGEAYLNENDADKKSRFLGCRLAEYRALIKAYKAKKREYVCQLKALKNYEKTLKSLRSFDTRNYWYITLTREMKNIQKNIESCGDAIAALHNQITLDINEYFDALKSRGNG